MPILDNNQFILSYNGGGVSPLNVSILPSSVTGNQNSTVFTFTESGSDLGSISRRYYVFDDESDSTSANPSYTFTKPGNKKVSAYFYSDSLSKVGYAEANLTIYQPSGYTCDLINNCDLCGALTRETLSYTGPLVRLFRESDWQVADIPYDSFDTLDVTSATTFLNLPVDDTLTGLPLDIMSPIKSLGFSTVRKLRTSYSGSAFRVRRSSDSVEQDIGFDVNGYVQVSAVTNFLTGSTTGFCTTVYNQGTLGSIGDWVQNTLVNQPIVDTSSFSYPTLDIRPWSGSSGVLMNNRNTNSVASNFTSISKINMFLITKAREALVLIPIILRFSSSYLSVPYNQLSNTYFSPIISFRFANSLSPITDWHMLTLRGRYDYTNDRRYLSIGANNYEIQSGSNNSSEADQPYVINLFKTATPFSLGQIELGYTTSSANTYNGWFSELILDDTDLTFNQFYKIKKFMASFQSLPYSASTNTGLRVNRIYNQKQSQTNGNHYIQNAVSNMPEFRISDPTFNRPTIYSVNTDTGDAINNNERRVSSITYNGSNTIYNNTYTFINLYVPASGSTNSVSMTKNSSNSVTAFWYHNYTNTGFNQLQIWNNSNVSVLFPPTSTTTAGSMTAGFWGNLTNPNNLKINGYRQLVQNGSRIMTLGTGSTSTSLTANTGTINTTRTQLFHNVNSTSGTAYRGGMFFDMSFGNIPTTNDWNNLIYPSLKNKYGTSDS